MIKQVKPTRRALDPVLSGSGVFFYGEIVPPSFTEDILEAFSDHVGRC